MELALVLASGLEPASEPVSGLVWVGRSASGLELASELVSALVWVPVWG